MARQYLAAAFDRFAESATCVARPETVGYDADNLVPASRLDFFIDSPIRQDHDTAFQERGENQNPRMIFGMMKTVSRKGGETVQMNRFSNSRFGDEESLNGGNCAKH